MWGRAGRRGRGLAVYIAGEDALDQFFCRHPDEFMRPRRRGGDHRSRQPRDLRRASALRRSRGAASATRRRVLRAAAGASARRPWPRPAFSASGRPVSCPLRADDYPGGPGRAALGRGRQLHPHRRRVGRGPGHDRGGPRLLDRARGRDLHAPRPLLPRPHPRPGWAPGAAGAVQRQLLHPDQAREHDLHRAPARPAPSARRDAVLRRGRVLRDGARLSAQGAAGPRGDRLPGPRSADGRVPDPGAVVRARRADRGRAVSGRSAARMPSTPSSTARSPSCR